MEKRQQLMKTILILLSFVVVLTFSGNVRGQGKEPSGLFPVQQNGKWGFINKDGKMVIEPQFDDIVQYNHDTTDEKAQESFSEGLACVNVGATQKDFGMMSGGKWGYIDTTGKLVIPPKFITASPFVDEMASVSIEDVAAKRRGLTITTMNGYINRNGRFIIPPQPYPFSLGRFSDGLAQVERTSAGRTLWGYADKTGKTVIVPRFDYAGVFSEGLARVEIGNAWGYIDKKGNINVKLQFDLAGNFLDGLAPVVSHGQLSFINRRGDLQFDVAGGVASLLEILTLRFSERLAPVKVGDRLGYIDQTGEFVIPPKFISADRFSEGLASVMVVTQQGIRSGYIDKTGAFAIAPQFTYAMAFYNGLARVTVGDMISGRMGYINKNGYVWRASK